MSVQVYANTFYEYMKVCMSKCGFALVQKSDRNERQKLSTTFTGDEKEDVEKCKAQRNVWNVHIHQMCIQIKYMHEFMFFGCIFWSNKKKAKSPHKKKGGKKTKYFITVFKFFSSF